MAIFLKYYTCVLWFAFRFICMFNHFFNLFFICFEELFFQACAKKENLHKLQEIIIGWPAGAKRWYHPRVVGGTTHATHSRFFPLSRGQNKKFLQIRVLCITTKTCTQIENFKRNFLKNYNNSEHVVKTKNGNFFSTGPLKIRFSLNNFFQIG